MLKHPEIESKQSSTAFPCRVVISRPFNLNMKEDQKF